MRFHAGSALLLVGGILVVSRAAPAQIAPPAAAPAVSIPSTELRRLPSRINGIEYELFVSLPPEYAKTADRYPVLYLLDGNVSFAIATDVYRLLRLSGDIPPFIIVGIGYPERDPAVFSAAYSANRTRDYTPTASERDPTGVRLPSNGGGADVFLRVLREEILPFIDHAYRTDPADRGLGGHSLGGLFSTYALFRAPDTFTRFWLGSPSLWWDNQVSWQYEQAYAVSHTDLHARVFTSVGELEVSLMVDPWRELERRVRSHGYASLRWTSMLYAGETHNSVPAGALARALTELYGKVAVVLDTDHLRAIEGKWRLSNGVLFEIAIQGDALLLSGLPPAQFRLFAESPTSFFVRGAGVQVRVPPSEPARPTHLSVRQQGQELVADRLP